MSRRGNDHHTPDGLTDAEIHERVIASRAAQGLPPKVERPEIIAEIQSIFREALPPYDITAPITR